MVSQPARVTRTVSTLIDHIYTNMEENINTVKFTAPSEFVSSSIPS